MTIGGLVIERTFENEETAIAVSEVLEVVRVCGGLLEVTRDGCCVTITTRRTNIVRGVLTASQFSMTVVEIITPPVVIHGSDDEHS